MEIKLISLLYILDLLHFCRRRRRPKNDRAAGTERSQSNSHNVVCFRKFASLLGVDQTEDQVNGGEKWKRYFSCNCSNLWLRNRKKRNVTTSRLCTALIWSLFQVLVREIVCFVEDKTIQPPVIQCSTKIQCETLDCCGKSHDE